MLRKQLQSDCGNQPHGEKHSESSTSLRCCGSGAGFGIHYEDRSKNGSSARSGRVLRSSSLSSALSGGGSC